jgi:hypothetical protein
MKCPKCGYTSFPYLESCRKCGQRLAEQHATFGPYALRPDPPDLWLAYQALNMDAASATLTPPLSTPAIDHGQLDEIELDLAETEQASPGTQEVDEQADATLDLIPTLDLEPVSEGELPPAESSAEAVSSQESVMPQPLELSELGDIALELEEAADPGGKSPERTQTPTESPEVKQVYDLDLDEDLDGLTLGAAIEGSRADDDDEETAEYTLEIEDDLELEVDELELEQDDEAKEEDDDHR